MKSNAGITDKETKLKELKLQKQEVLEKLKQYRYHHKLEAFEPHEIQQKFFNALRDESKKTFVLLGGNRMGKTAASIGAAVSLALGRYPWVPVPTKPLQPKAIRIVDGEVVEGAPIPTPPDEGLLRFLPPIRIRIFGEDMTSLEKVQIPKLEEFCAPEWIAGTKKNSFGQKTHWVFTNGSTIDLLTYNQTSDMMEGWSGHVCIYDEPPPRAIYIANFRGLVDCGGISIFSMTPLKEPWIADEIVNNPSPTCFTITGNTRDNPHLTEQFIKDFEDALTPEEKETRIAGKFLHLQGLVFKDFNKEIHVVDSFEPDPDDTCYASLDTHPRTEQAIAFMSVDKRGNQFIIHESFKHGTPDAVADRVLDFHRTVHKLHRVVIEPASKGDSNRGQSTFDIIKARLRKEDIILELGSKDLSGGILQMQEGFKSRNGLASLFIARRCERCLFEIQRYVWKDWRFAGSQDKNEMNKPADKDDHIIECTRRLVQLPAVWINPVHRQDLLAANRYRPMDEEAGY